MSQHSPPIYKKQVDIEVHLCLFRMTRFNKSIANSLRERIIKRMVFEFQCSLVVYMFVFII